jgi:anti-anti-sigma factor
MSTTSHPWTRTEGDRAILTLQGHVGLMSVADLYAAARTLVDEPTSAAVVVDCSALEYADASAVQVLLALAAALASGGRTLAFRDVSPAAERYLRLAGVPGWLNASAGSNQEGVS